MSLKGLVVRFLRINELKYALTGLLEAKLELKRLEIQERVENSLTDVVYLLVASFLGLIVLLFLSIIASIALNMWLESDWMGYAIISGFYSLMLLFWVIKKTFLKAEIRKQINQSINEKINFRFLSKK